MHTAVMALPQPALNNTGGCLLFGPDGMLYIAFGDGGPSYDANGLGQNLADLHRHAKDRTRRVGFTYSVIEVPGSVW